MVYSYLYIYKQNILYKEIDTYGVKERKREN